MNPIGINLWNWTAAFDESKTSYIEKAAALGFTAVEIGMEKSIFDSAAVKKVIDNHHLQVTLCAALGKGRDISNFDETVRKETKKYMLECFQTGEKIGANLFVGPVFAGGGKTHLLNPEDKKKEWNLAVTGLQEMADIAANYGMNIGIEPINRYRTSVVNTVDQVLQMIEDIGKHNVGILFDTYQANIEERDIAQALIKVCKSEHLIHFHASDSNRGAPGMGHVPFEKLLGILKDYKYSGHITMETFANGVYDCGWNILDEPDIVAKKGIEALRKLNS